MVKLEQELTQNYFLIIKKLAYQIIVIQHQIEIEKQPRKILLKFQIISPLFLLLIIKLKDQMWWVKSIVNKINKCVFKNCYIYVNLIIYYFL